MAYVGNVVDRDSQYMGRGGVCGHVHGNFVSRDVFMGLSIKVMENTSICMESAAATMPFYHEEAVTQTVAILAH